MNGNVPRKKRIDDEEDLPLTTAGREWYFKRLAVSWTHKF